MEQVPPPPAGTPEGHAVVHRDFSPIVDVWHLSRVPVAEVETPHPVTV